MSSGVSNDAILFFDDNRVAKEMLYPEFDAILDNVVGIAEFAGQQVKAAFIRINPQLCVTDAVFFLIEFHANGYVDRNWNLPLQHLADTAGLGPDLGAGRIKLACRSQCSVSWHQRSLWDPNMDAVGNTLDMIAASVARNRLGLARTELRSEPQLQSAPEALQSISGTERSRDIEKEVREQLSKKFQQEIKTRTTTLLEEQKLRIAAMKSEAQDHIEKLHSQYRSELARLAEALQSTKTLFSEEKNKNLQLKKTLDEHARELQKTRENYYRELEQGKEVSQDQLLDLEKKFESEARARIDTATAELKEMLDMREVELFYRDEQVGRLNAEIAQLRTEKQQLLDSQGDMILQRLTDNGITFVACQPGIDAITVPLSDMAGYLDSPLDYVADKCSVDKQIYHQWVAHYELPVCRHTKDDGSTCAKPVPKVEKLARFISGESDRCAKHNRAATALSSLMKVR